jgi:DNA repair protein RadC
MSGSQQGDGSGVREKPYGLIYASLRERWRAEDGAGQFAAAPPVDPEAASKRPELARFCRRLGAVPRSWGARRAARGVRDIVARMAAEAAAPDGEVWGALLAFCADERHAVCSRVPHCAECPASEYCDYPTRRPTIKDLPATERPRERLLRGGEDGMSDTELLAIIIRSGSDKATALELAARLMSRFKDFRRLAESSAAELTQVRGIGPAKAAQIKAALAIARRYASQKLTPGTAVTGSEQLFRYMREKLYGLKKEHFLALMLDTKHRILRQEEVAVGSLNESVVHPREVFKTAIRESAAKVLFVHNHPSGNPEPSPQDRRLTARLCEAGRLVGIGVLDHLIVGDEGYFSFAEHGLLDRPGGS